MAVSPFRWLFGGRLSPYTAFCCCAQCPPFPSRRGTSTPSVSVSPGRPELKCSSWTGTMWVLCLRDLLLTSLSLGSTAEAFIATTVFSPVRKSSSLGTYTLRTAARSWRSCRSCLRSLTAGSTKRSVPDLKLGNSILSLCYMAIIHLCCTASHNTHNFRLQLKMMPSCYFFLPSMGGLCFFPLCGVQQNQTMTAASASFKSCSEEIADCFEFRRSSGWALLWATCELSGTCWNGRGDSWSRRTGTSGAQGRWDAWS